MAALVDNIGSVSTTQRYKRNDSAVANIAADELLKPAGLSRVDRAELSQPLCTALQIALFRHLERIGVSAEAVVGHSSGEIGAAYAAGFLTLEYALALAYYRGLVTTKQTVAGSMAAVGLGSQDAARFLKDGIVVACENSPSSTTISGNRDAVEEVVAAIKAAQPDTFARALKVDMAYHSREFSLPKTCSPSA